MSNIVNRGATPNDPNADTLYEAFGKVNTEFGTLKGAAKKDVGTGSNDVAAGNAPAAAVTAHETNHPAPTNRDTRNEAAGTAAGLMTTHETTHPAPTVRDARNEAAIGAKGTAFNKNFGTSAGDVCQGNDARLSDSRTPTAHTHTLANITDAGNAAGKNVGTGANDVAAGNHTHSDLHTRQHSMNSASDHQMATARMIGRTTAGSGAPEELTAANVRDFISVEESASAFNGTKVVGINPQTGTTYTLVIGDAGKYIRMNNANAITLTVPLNNSVEFPTGTVITIIQIGAGVITVGGASVTFNKFKGLKTAGQYAAIQLIKVDTNTWDVIGGVA